MNAPSASRCACHESVMATSSSSANYSTRQPRSPVLPRTNAAGGRNSGRRASFTGCGADASLGGRVTLLLLLLRVVAGHQRGRRLHQLFGEVALAGEQLLGEVVGAGHD